MRLTPLVIVVVPLLLAGCSKATDSRQMADVASTNQAASGPDIAPTAAPGVALTYTYRFRVPIQRITAVQEQHAMACEALGPAKCRIVGMHYLAGPNRAIDASLALKLAPSLARTFAKQAIGKVVEAGGMLAEASIDSVDAGATLAAAQRTERSLNSEGNDLSKQLTGKSAGELEREQLQERTQALHDATRATQQAAAEAAALLAETPLTIQYQSGAVDPGFADGPVLGAIKDGWANIVSGFATIVLIVITLAPWLAAIALILFLFYRLRDPVRHFLGMDRDEP